jgi:hypothetical protein
VNIVATIAIYNRFLNGKENGNYLDYSKGVYATIPISWNDRAGALTILIRPGKEIETKNETGRKLARQRERVQHV